MNSKKKNKNRQNKPPNPTPPQKQDVSEPLIPPEVLNTEIESVVEERVPNIISENVAAEVKETEETPKKPKRNRGKKKKEDEKSDIEDERTEDPVLNSEIEPLKESLNEAIAPNARKKKNKNKKGQGNIEIIDETKPEKKDFDESSNQPQEITAMKVEEQEQEMKSSKKKNKKKKNRNDSEKSDKVEEVSCTTAFQKLLVDDGKAQTLPPPSTDDSSISEATVKEVQTTPQTNITPSQNQPLQKDEGKYKKKNKKDKKQPIDVSTNSELSQSSQLKAVESVKNVCDVRQGTSEAILKDDTEIPDEAIPSTSTEAEKSKNKAKFAKPVEKKKKGKGFENISQDNLETNVLEAKEGDIKKVKDTEVASEQQVSSKESEVLITEDLDDVILVPLTEITPDWQEEVKIEEGNGPVIGCEEKTEIQQTGQSIDNIATNKKGKKSPKPQKKIEAPENVDIASETTKLEEKLFEASSSSKEPAERKTAIKLDVIPETKLEEKSECVKGTKENIEITADIVKTDIIKLSIPPKELVPETNISTELLRDAPDKITQKDKLEEKKDQKPDTETASSSDNKTEHIQVVDKDKRNRKKSPKPQRKTDKAMIPVTLTETLQSEITHIVEEAAPASCSEILPQKSEESLQIQQDVLVEQKCDVEQMQTPHGEKRHKRKKSPKPIVGIDVASGSKDSQESKKNVIKMEDIIIIQAEVVSDEKALGGDTFIATQNITAKQDTVDKMEVEHDTEKSKKRKKSPKPSQKDSKREIKDNMAAASLLETSGKIEIPITPETQLSPNVVAFELETPKTDPVPSPSDVTPDLIEYPRCSSEQLDVNNNMVIQEISHSEAKIDTPLMIQGTPIIQSSINSPELTSSASNVMNKEEKTDLKSKVMEVNQDMEELRLSIERSLAELTSLEKSDKDVQVNVKDENTEIVDNVIEVKSELPIHDNRIDIISVENEPECTKAAAVTQHPICPARKDHKGKGKSKKKGKETTTQTQSSQQLTTTTVSETSTKSEDTKTEDSSKSEQKSDDAKGTQKKQASEKKGNKDEDVIVNDDNSNNYQSDFEPIENFEEAMTSSVDDVNKTFEMIVNDVNTRLTASHKNPEINVTEPQEENKDNRQDKQNPVSPPKNLLGHPDIPVPSNKTDYKKEKNKPPNNMQAKVKIKDANQVEIETMQKTKQSKESQTETKSIISYKRPDESICVTNQNDDYVYKYSFRKVFLQCACHVCKKDLKQTRVPCSNCNLIFYCNQKHKDEDYTQHQALCFAVSTIVHLKDLKFLYADARDVTGHNYRLLRMQMIVSCEKVLKRRLAPWEQEALLYPRMCGNQSCREWRQGNLKDCEGCGQISYCSEHPEHLPKSHSRWCKSYNLYRALVKHQQTKGRLEPKLPTKIVELSPLPDNINEVLASMYEEKIDMSDIEYAALTQLATAPLTALLCLQHIPNTVNGITKKSTLTVHIVGAELQFEADVLNKWEVFLLHLVPDVKELQVVLVGPDLNPSNLPVELLGKIKFCENCRQTKRRVVFGFQDKRTYHQYWASEDFTAPDLVCAFNPSIQRSSTYNGKDTWPFTINCILKLKVPFAITSHTLSELTSDLLRIQECASVAYKVVLAPKKNSFASVRPDRNFISDDEAPLLFKNHCVAVVCGV